MVVRMLSIALFFGLFLLVPSGHSAAQQPIAYHSIVIYDVVSTGCGINQTQVTSIMTMPTDETVSLRVMLHIGDRVYMDKDFPFSPNDGCIACRLLIHLNDTNAGGSVNTPFPLPRNTPFTVVAEIRSEAGIPLWRSVAQINRCNGGRVTDVKSVKGFQLIRNNFLEQTVTNTRQPLYWQTTPGIQGRVSCGTEFRQGQCSYMIQQGASRVSIWQTVVTPTASEKGDHYAIYVNRKSENLVRNARAYVTFHFVNDTTHTVSLDLGSGNKSWDDYIYDFGPLPTQNVRQVTMQINVPAGTGKIWLDWLEVHIVRPEAPGMQSLDDYSVLPDSISQPGLVPLPMPEAPDLQQ